MKETEIGNGVNANRHQYFLRSSTCWWTRMLLQIPLLILINEHLLTTILIHMHIMEYTKKCEKILYTCTDTNISQWKDKYIGVINNGSCSIYILLLYSLVFGYCIVDKYDGKESGWCFILCQVYLRYRHEENSQTLFPHSFFREWLRATRNTKAEKWFSKRWFFSKSHSQ